MDHSAQLSRRAVLQNQMDRTREQEKYAAYRVRVLPGQLDSARRKVAALENEARRLGFTDLLEE